MCGSCDQIDFDGQLRLTCGGVVVEPCSSSATVSPALPSIVELAIATPTLSTLVTVLTLPAYSGVLEALSGTGPFTVFAPTDAAFAAAGVDPSNVAAVIEVLKYHVISGAIPSSALAPSQFVLTLQGEAVVVTKSLAGVFVNGAAKVVIPDVMASNGVVHVIDTLLLPPALLANPPPRAVPMPSPGPTTRPAPTAAMDTCPRLGDCTSCTEGLGCVWSGRSCYLATEACSNAGCANAPAECPV
jgi:uncharacterized surface protein with fasciclin (FAS1) repeats